MTNKLFTVLEPKYRINSLEHFPDSGLIFLPCQAERIGTYFVPSLGKAPKWCSFIENLTEEMEENSSKNNNVYQEYRFLSEEDLEAVNATHMIGSKFVQSAIGGFIMKAKLYEKMKLQAQPFDLE